MRQLFFSDYSLFTTRYSLNPASFAVESSVPVLYAGKFLKHPLLPNSLLRIDPH